VFVSVLALSLVLGSGSAAAGAVPDAVFDSLAKRGRVRVIVGLWGGHRAEGELHGSARAAQRAAIAADQSRLLRDLAGSGHRLNRRFRSIPYLALDVPPAALARLESHALVRSVQEDVAEAPSLAQSAPLVEAAAAWASGLDGSGQVIAVLDTGADHAHEMLSGKVLEEACFSDGRDCPNGQRTQFGTGAAAPCSYSAQDCGHGTHVSGIALGDGVALAGVARGAQLVSVQVYSKFSGSADCGSTSPCALSYVSDQIDALEYVLSLQGAYPVAAVNLSLGGQVYAASCDWAESARKAAIDNLRSVGVPTIVSSGNDGDGNGLSAPSCISTAVSVGSSTKADAVSSFSNSDDGLSLLAPGSAVRSALPGGGTTYRSGTSMASPHVAGAWAILKQHVPGISVAEALAAFQTTGIPITDARNGLARGRIRIYEAADSLHCIDGDADGVCDADDLCPGFDDVLDADADGLPDGCDPDDDGDGLPDGVETLTGVFESAVDTGTDPFDPDSDGDGHLDGEEVAAASDPNDYASRPARPVPLLGSLGRALLVVGLMATCSRLRWRRPAGAAGLRPTTSPSATRGPAAPPASPVRPDTPWRRRRLRRG
jgi:subtilisin family serine protease